jgi:hypothetical protein
VQNLAAEEKLSAQLFRMEPKIRYVIIGYGTQYQLLMPYGDGHLSIGIEMQDNPVEIASKIRAALNMRP